MTNLQTPQHIEGADEEKQRSLELRGLLHAVLRYLWLIALAALLVGSTAWLYVRRLPNMYRSMAVIEIQARSDKAFESKDEDQDLKNPEAIETIIQNFRNRSLMERVTKALNLGANSQFLGFTPDKPVAPDAITDRLLAGASAGRRGNTRLVDVAFVHPDPVMARKVANALVDQFVAQGKQEHIRNLREQNELLKAKYSELKDKLAASDQKLQNYKREKLQSTSLESVSVEDRRNYVEDKLRGLNSDLLAASGERRGMESDKDLVKQANGDSKLLLAIASIAQDPQAAVAQAQLSKAEADLAGLAEHYRDKHPRIIEQRSQLDNARAALAEAARTAPSRFDSRYNAALSKEKGLQTAVSEQEKALLGLEEKLIPYRELVREFESDRVLAESVLQKLKESTLALGGGDQQAKGEGNSGNFQVVEPAVSAVPQVNRRLLIVTAAAFGAGALIAIVIAGMHFLNTSIRTVDTAECLLGLPVIAAIPTMPRTRKSGGMLALLNSPNTAAAEGFRTLRCALSLMGPKTHHGVFLFTSAVPGEGKSLVAANTAIAFAQQGFKTLLVEADLRRPAVVAKLMGIREKLPGIGNLVDGTPPPITITSVPKLSLLPAGSRTANPAELLSSAQFAENVKWMKASFDRIVIDTAPVNVVSDTLNIVGCASVICLVVRSNSTSRKVVKRAIELLRRAGRKADGLVLNCMPQWNGIDNHYDYSGRTPYGDAETYGDAYVAGLQRDVEAVAAVEGLSIEHETLSAS